MFEVDKKEFLKLRTQDLVDAAHDLLADLDKTDGLFLIDAHLNVIRQRLELIDRANRQDRVVAEPPTGKTDAEVHIGTSLGADTAIEWTVRNEESEDASS